MLETEFDAQAPEELIALQAQARDGDVEQMRDAVRLLRKIVGS
jgi:hypothetical protein